MAVLDIILNCACLLLWLNWRSRGLAAPVRVTGIALVSTLKRTRSASSERWVSPAVLVTILFVRAIIYWQIGSVAHWTPRLSLEAIVLSFRGDMFSRMLLYSLLGFLQCLAAFCFSLLLLAAVNRRDAVNDPWLALVRAHLGRAAALPGWLLLLLPAAITFCFWLIAGPLLGVMAVQLPAGSFRQLVEQAFVIALGSWLLWQYVLVGLLVLHIVSSYVYLGSAPFWNFLNTTARNLLRPASSLPLRVGKIDLVPILALAVVVTIAVFTPRLLAALYMKLPF